MSWEYCLNGEGKDKAKKQQTVTVTYCSNKCVKCAQARDSFFKKGKTEVSEVEPIKKLPSLAVVMQIKSKL